MLTAKQYNRQFLSQVISLIYLFLVFSIFSEPQLTDQASADNDETGILAGVSPGISAEAILTASDDYLDGDYLPTPSREHKSACIFSASTTNHFYHQQWKQYAISCLEVQTVPVKRYLLFSCLRLSEAPPLA